uniref:Uncharacterized protein n=1 Tax=Anguilla anguilla TaxID=7936 RepID=A0A0E9RGD9_ANGAN
MKCHNMTFQLMFPVYDKSRGYWLSLSILCTDKLKSETDNLEM